MSNIHQTRDRLTINPRKTREMCAILKLTYNYPIMFKGGGMEEN